MKVLLISANTVTTPHPVYPLGLDYVMQALTPRHEVRILDMNVAGAQDRLEDSLRVDRPDVIGISIRNIDNEDTLDTKSFIPGYEALARFIRARTKAPIVLGGSGFSIFPREFMSRLDADFGVVGEGEAMSLLLAALEERTDPAVLPGIVTRGGSVGRPVPWTGKVARRTAPGEAGLRFYLDRGGIMNLQTKRGCPFRCFYCSFPLIEGRKFRFFPPEEVARQARELEELGARFLFITDSVFNADEDHSLAVAEAFRRERLGIPWGAFLAPRRPADGYYRVLADAGMTHAEFGTESLCNPQLKRYQKPFQAEEVFAAHASARRAGIHIAHYFLLGGPGEDAQTLEETLAGMEALGKAVFFLFCGVRIFPQTPLYRLSLEEGQIAPDQDLLTPIFYRSKGIAKEEIRERVKRQARGRLNWIYGDGSAQTERAVARMYARGHSGPLWELLLR